MSQAISLRKRRDGSFFDYAEDEGRSSRNQVFLQILVESDQAHLEVLGLCLFDLPDVEVDEAHGEHVVGEKGELILAVGIVGRERVPKERDVFLLCRCLEGKWQVVFKFGGFFHGSCLRSGRSILAPNASKSCLDFFLEVLNQFPVRCHQNLLGFDFGDDGLLCGKGWEGNSCSIYFC